MTTTTKPQPQPPQPATPPERDLELLRAAAGGDRLAFHVLVDRHSKELFRLAVALSRNRSDAEDVLQETFVGAYRGLSQFNGRSSVKTWLVQILVNRARTAGAREARTVPVDPGGPAVPFDRFGVTGPGGLGQLQR